MGDLVALSPRGPPAIQIDGLSSNTRLEDVTVNASPGMAIMARYVRGKDYLRVRVQPGPIPPGAHGERLLSSNADAINYAYARSGPVIERSVISRQGDDAINLHGLVLGVAEQDDQMGVIALRPFGSDNSLAEIMRAGDQVRLLSGADFEVRGVVKLASIAKIPSRSTATGEILDRLYPRSHRGDRTTASFYRVRFDQPVPAGIRYLEFPALAANGFVIRDNQLSYNRGHGVIVGAASGLIVRNVMSHLTHNAIVVGPNFDPWREGGWVNHVSIKDNEIDAACLDRDAPKRGIWTSSTIAIGATTAMREEEGYRGNRHINVSGNRLSACSGSWVGVSKSRNVSVARNTFVARPHQSAACRANGVSIYNSEKVEVNGNKCASAQN